MVKRHLLHALATVVLVISFLVTASTVAQAEPSAGTAAECPPVLRCVVIAAAYQGNNPTDATDYGNYDTANRPIDMAINSVVVHDTEGTLQDVLDAFRDPKFYVSSHYVIAADGTVYQMVRLKDVAWHAANWWYNMHSVGIEHVGHAVNGSTEYTPAMYAASATLVRWLAGKYHFPLDRQHIMGHDNVPGVSGARIPKMHVDPGPYWNWQLYMNLLGSPVVPTGGLKSTLVTVAPNWALNKQPVTGCWPDANHCTTSNTLPTSIVYLHTAPDQNAPLLSDPVLGQGTTEIGNTAAKAYYGERFAQAGAPKIDTHGLWVQVYYDGQVGWIDSPWSSPTVLPTSGTYLTPKAGLSSVAVYGRPLPEKSEYPADFTAPAGAVPYPEPLPYTILAGQKYSVVGGSVKTDHYYAWTWNSSLPYDHTLFTGATKYVRIQYNGRQAFVRASDVTLS